MTICGDIWSWPNQLFSKSWSFDSNCSTPVQSCYEKLSPIRILSRQPLSICLSKNHVFLQVMHHEDTLGKCDSDLMKIWYIFIWFEHVAPCHLTQNKIRSSHAKPKLWRILKQNTSDTTWTLSWYKFRDLKAHLLLHLTRYIFLKKNPTQI